MVRTELWKEVGSFRGEMFDSSADLDMWLRILSTGHTVRIINEPLIMYRESAHSFSYHYKRERLDAHHSLLVLRHYVSLEKDCLSRSELSDYEFMEFKDAVSRAINYLIQEDRRTARSLVLQHLSWRVLNAARHSLWQAKVFFVGLSTVVLTFVRLGDSGREYVRKARFS